MRFDRCWLAKTMWYAPAQGLWGELWCCCAILSYAKIVCVNRICLSWRIKISAGKHTQVNVARVFYVGQRPVYIYIYCWGCVCVFVCAYISSFEEEPLVVRVLNFELRTGERGFVFCFFFGSLDFDFDLFHKWTLFIYTHFRTSANLY